MKGPVEFPVSHWPTIFGIEWNYKKLALAYLVLVLLLPPLMVYFDQSLSLVLKEFLSREMIEFWDVVTWFGEAGQYILISLLIFLFFRFSPAHWLSSLSHRKRKLQQASLFMFTCFVTSGVLALIGKFLIGRQRPYGSDNLEALVFEPFNFDHVFQSLPSGHAQVIFTLGAVFSLYYPRYNLLYLALVVVIAASRLTVFNHFLSDVIAGAVVGLSGVVLTYRFFYKNMALPEQVATTKRPELPEGLADPS